MDILATVKPIIEIYRDIILKRPVISVTISIFAGFVYATFVIQPEVEPTRIDIKPTEQYELEESNFKIQRIDITTGAMLLRNVKIRVELPMELELFKFDMYPHLPCSFVVNKFGDDRSVFDFSCSTFNENQRAELIIGTTKALSRGKSVKVEVSGVTEEGQRIIFNAEGMFWGL